MDGGPTARFNWRLVFAARRVQYPRVQLFADFAVNCFKGFLTSKYAEPEKYAKIFPIKTSRQVRLLELI